ncbi:hypothetical protein OF83DRAFT_1032097, partial [Amylostereum chailletii]
WWVQMQERWWQGEWPMPCILVPVEGALSWIEIEKGGVNGFVIVLICLSWW